MATIYGDQHIPLKALLASAGKSEDATLLIPDLQRPYVWQPKQVIDLVDSLIRGWPFGTLLTWRVKSDDPARELARSFWRVVVPANEEDGEPISMKHPPASFLMVLDGQQRIQSLLLALGGDSWGFKLLDRQWHEHIREAKSRGPRGKAHWSLGCLCVDVHALNLAYAQQRRATSIDYAAVLKWVVTDDANGHSKLSTPPNYKRPLPLASECGGQFVRLSRLWETAPDRSIDNYEAEDIAERLLSEHGVSDAERGKQKRALGALLIALREVKQTRVTYLELAEYEEAHGNRDDYNDAIVQIFTRLNSAGRTLTREDITFAWLKIGWDTTATQNESAKACIDMLTEDLNALSVPLKVEDVISAVSFIWSASFNAGGLITNNNLVRGDAIRPMAAQVSKNWHSIVQAATKISTRASDRGLRFREHYQSVNALAYLWSWYFIALHWAEPRKLSMTEKDALEKLLDESLDKYMDRWLICSQWAGVWSSSSATTLGRYASRLATCAQGLSGTYDVKVAVDTLASQIDADLKEIEQSAVSFLSTINADEREQVRIYYTALWLWNRLDKRRWNNAKIALRQSSRRKTSAEVDHIVPCDLWNRKLKASPTELIATEGDQEEWQVEDLRPSVNELGNCMLLEKNFNISKSNSTLKSFLESVHEFKDHKLALADWGSALDLDMDQVDSSATPIETLHKLFIVRSQKIRADLEKFIRGVSNRIDLGAD
jgi:5-methylcytosine-specific restriction endonuclease McrA